MGLELRRLLGKKRFGGILDTKSITAEAHLVEIHDDDLFFGVHAFELDGNDPFLELERDFREQSTGPAAGIVQFLGQLLGNRGTAALPLVHQEERLEADTRKCLKINAGMVIKTGILRRHQGVDQILRKLIVADIGTVALGVVFLEFKEGCQHFSVSGKDLRRIGNLRGLQFCEIRDLGRIPNGQEQNKKAQNRPAEKAPKADDDDSFRLRG